jgi:Cof subfamily protein (haloacid dehalogenase superfamily)
MMHPYKAVFIDLDGTLLNRHAQVSPRNAECLKKLVAQGVHVVVATGRPVESIRQLVGSIQSQAPVISLSGSMVHKSLYGEPLASQIIPFETMHRLLEVCRGLGGVKNILLDEAEGFYALQDDPVIDEFIGMYGKKPIPFTYDSVPQGPVLSILVHAREDRRAVYQTLHEQFGELVHFTYFREYPWIELSAFESNKGQAMSIVCQHLGISVDEAIAIGDGANDLEMIAAAGLGIAMENGDDEVKAVADRLAPHHNLDGVAEVLEEIFRL